MSSVESRRNTYPNGATPAPTDVPADMAGFMLAIDPILASAAVLARVVAHAHASYREKVDHG